MMETIGNLESLYLTLERQVNTLAGLVDTELDPVKQAQYKAEKHVVANKAMGIMLKLVLIRKRAGMSVVF